MTKISVLIGSMLVSSSAFAASTAEQDYQAALACLQNLNQAYQYQWTSGSSPSTYDATSGDTFIVVAGENAGFVRFGTTTPEPQRCTFKSIHNATRDCVKIQDANGQDIVVMKYVYPPEKNREACNPNNADSTTRFLYSADSGCEPVSYEKMGPLLQKQIASNTRKMIVEKAMTRKSFDSAHRSACEGIHNTLRKKYSPGVGSDYGAVVNDAVREVPVVADPAKKGGVGQ